MIFLGFSRSYSMVLFVFILQLRIWPPKLGWWLVVVVVVVVVVVQYKSEFYTFISVFSYGISST